MQSDERQIRDLVRTWMEATKAGEIDKVLELMTEDAVFLVPGHPPMRKSDFEQQAKAQARQKGQPAAVIDGRSEIQEVTVSGDWAFLWSRLSVTMTPPGGAAVERAGHTLTVFKKDGGRWRLARDANLLAVVQK
jgi:uncharacterized protein (TIGR02246 family)